MSKGISCFLRALWNSDKIINLPDGQPVLIGRNEETGITDLHVSRIHLECTADYNAGTVSVKALGKCYSGCNGYALIKNSTYTLKNGDRLEVRLGYHEFDVTFESPEEENSEPKAKKPKLDIATTSINIPSNNSSTWEFIDDELLIYTSENCQSRSLIGAFDIDGTIIKTKSGARFPKDFADWELNYANVVQKLQQLHDDEYKIILFSNQAGLEKDKSKINGFKEKVEKIINTLGVPIQAFIAVRKRSMYRKPVPGMWNFLSQHKNDNIQIDMDNSFFVGDAAGRQDKWALKKKKDHSVSDRLFALNLGLQFYTPEEYFLLGGASVHKYKMPDFDPRSLQVSKYPQIAINKTEVIVMVGSPGSGKSFYSKTVLVAKGYIHVSRDQLGSWQKCVKQAEEHLSKNKSVVIDNTNPDRESRQRYIEVAKKFGVNCRCFVMDVTFEHAKHNNKFRELTDETHVPINEIILNTYKKNYKEPTHSEGFTDIIKIPFVPKFDNSEHEKLYKMYLLEQ